MTQNIYEVASSYLPAQNIRYMDSVQLEYKSDRVSQSYQAGFKYRKISNQK
jgi:hypothetical protein